MFENALIVRAGTEKHVDIGLVAETILFYGTTQILLDRGSILSLARSIGHNDLIAFFDRSNAKLSYLQSSFGVVSSGQPRTHDFGAFQFGGTKDRKIKDFREEIEFSLERELGATTETKRFIRALNDRVALHRFKGEARKAATVPDLAREDSKDATFIRNAAIVVLKGLLGSFEPDVDFRFELFDTGSGFAVSTNLDYSSLNQTYHQSISPQHSSVSSEYILSHILVARADSYFASHYMAEIVTTPIHSDLIQLKHFDFLRRRQLNESEIELFKETILPDFPSVRDAINSGDRSISEFLNLLDQAEKFKDWLRAANSDVGIVRSYFKAATEKTWADKLPTKSVRLAIATGLAAAAEAIFPSGISAASGLGIGAADALYLDKVLKGWRPSQFIEGPYRKFIG